MEIQYMLKYMYLYWGLEITPIRVKSQSQGLRTFWKFFPYKIHRWLVNKWPYKEEQVYVRHVSSYTYNVHLVYSDNPTFHINFYFNFSKPHHTPLLNHPPMVRISKAKLKHDDDPGHYFEFESPVGRCDVKWEMEIERGLGKWKELKSHRRNLKIRNILNNIGKL